MGPAKPPSKPLRNLDRITLVAAWPHLGPNTDQQEAYEEFTCGMVGFGTGEWQSFTRTEDEQKFVRYLARKLGLNTPEDRNQLHKLLEQAHTEAEDIGPKVKDLIAWMKSYL